jgi:hypothetical protein
MPHVAGTSEQAGHDTLDRLAPAIDPRSYGMSTMTQNELDTCFADPVAQKLLAASIPARLAYTGLDGRRG